METLQRTANRGSLSTGFDISNSLKLEPDNTEYLHYTPASQTDYERMTFSIWIKRTELSTTQTIAEFGNGTANTTQLRIGFDTSDKLFIYGNSIVWRLSSRVFRDTSAWYHLFFKFDTTQGTSNDRIRVWVNGNMIAHTDFGTVNNPGSGTAMGFNKTNQQTLGTQDEDGPKNYFSGYIAQAWGSGGTPPNVTDFGEVDSDSGIWKPIDISGVSIPDANGFFLDFSDSSDLGNDSSSNNNDFTLNNITAADQATDVPTNNFCTMNTNFKTSSSIVVSEGQTKVTCGSGTGWLSNVATFALTKGKWYWELASVTSVYQIFGIADASDSIIPQAAGGYYVGYGSNDTTLSVGMYMINGSIYGNQDGGSGVGIAAGAVGDIFGVCLDLDNLGFYITRNGVSPSGSDPTSGSSLTGAVTWNDSIYSGFYYPAVSVFQGNGLEMNFGGYTSNPIASAASDANGYGNFEYAPPSGYYAICTKNLAEYG
jgi:hypothetical protein